MTSSRSDGARLGLALLSVAVLGSAGCDTLRARHRASEGAECYKKSDLAGAMYKYEQAAQIDGSIDVVQLNLGYIYAQMYQAAPKTVAGVEYGGMAIKSFESYLKHHPENAAARNYLVQTFVDTNRYDDAVAFFKPEIEGDKPNLEAISTLAQIASKTNRIDRALEWYDKRVQMNPKDADAPYNLGVLVWDYLHQHQEMVGQSRLDLADRGIVALRKAIELRPHDVNGWTYSNLVYREKSSGEPDDARKAIDTAEAEQYMKAAAALKAPNATPPPLPPPPTYPAPAPPEGSVPPPPPAPAGRKRKK